jgi:hypothetical protein
VVGCTTGSRREAPGERKPVMMMIIIIIITTHPCIFHIFNKSKIPSSEKKL